HPHTYKHKYNYIFIPRVPSLKLRVNKLARPVGPSLPLISFSRKEIMTSEEASSKIAASSNSYVGPITRSRSKETQHEDSQTPVIANKMLRRMTESAQLEIAAAENLMLGKFISYSQQPNETSSPDVMSVMMTDAGTSEERMAEVEKKISMLLKMVEEKDQEIASLRNQMESRDVAESSQTPAIKDKGKIIAQDQSQHSASIASLSVQQLQDMIMNSIRAQYGGPTQNSLLYSKPYTKRIDNLRMPHGYQPPKFQQFDGKGNPKQHVAHFVETCENAGTRGDQLVRQFVRTLKGNAFDWYTDLEPETIDSWEQLEKEFLNRFYSTRRTVSMIELTEAKQRKDEPVC
ncbi:retrotransposon gag domain-containing protein, partial [Salmonella enterica]|nr:retrotransposon gag domain-containing protein [Salmonella enterica]